jgi:hypothetical protein
VIVAVAVALPSTSAARTARVYADAYLPHGQGQILVSGFRNQVSVDVIGPTVGAGYGARGAVTARRISGSLGAFGAVDLTFEPRGKPRRRSISPCSGSLVVRRGVFTGTFVLHAEEGIADVEATSLRGRMMRDSTRCTRADFEEVETPNMPSGRRRHYTEVVLEASNSPLGQHGTTFSATHRSGKQRVRFEAYRSRRVGAVSAYIGARAVGARSSFSYDLKARTASVAPPTPFAGQAQLGTDAYSVPTWAGDLALTPTTVGIPLTGGTFQAGLSRHRITEIFIQPGSLKSRAAAARTLWRARPGPQPPIRR